MPKWECGVWEKIWRGEGVSHSDVWVAYFSYNILLLL